LHRELKRYYPTPSKEELAAAYTDPRAKKSPHLNDAYLKQAKQYLRNRVEHCLLDALKEDPLKDGQLTGSKGESGAENSREQEEGAPPAAPAVQYRGAFSHLIAPAAAASSVDTSIAPEPTSRKSKTDEVAERTDKIMEAWEDVPGNAIGFMGPGSSKFDFFEFYRTLDLGKDVGEEGTNAFKVAANSLHGFTSAAAGPERIFSRAGLICNALRNRLSTWVLELIVFLSKNRAFMPSVEEVVKEITRRAKAKSDIRKTTRKTARAASSPSSPSFFSLSASSSSSLGAAAADDGYEKEEEEEQSDADGSDTEDEEVVLSEHEIDKLLNDIADYRTATHHDNEDDDSFAAFIADVERHDRTEELDFFGL
jgi:hypothetical protein